MFLVFDLETTGLATTSCDIIQLAYILFDSNNNFVRAENLHYYYDRMSWSQEVADKSHQISLEFLKGHKDEFERNVMKAYSVFNRANVIGHNSDHFDCPFLKAWLARQGLSEFQFGIKQDTMKAFKPITKRARIKLTKLSEMMGLTTASIKFCAETWFGTNNIRGPHDAAYDVAATALLTLKGLEKGLISFENLAEAVSNDDYTSLAEYEDTISVDKVIDPNGFIVMLNEDDHLTPYWVNHDKSAYTELDIVYTDDELKNYLQSNYTITTPLDKVSVDTYVGHNGILTYTLVKGAGDVFHVSSPYFNKLDTDMDMKEHIRNAFHTGGDM